MDFGSFMRDMRQRILRKFCSSKKSVFSNVQKITWQSLLIFSWINRCPTDTFVMVRDTGHVSLAARRARLLINLSPTETTGIGILRRQRKTVHFGDKIKDHQRGSVYHWLHRQNPCRSVEHHLLQCDFLLFCRFFLQGTTFLSVKKLLLIP